MSTTNRFLIAGSVLFVAFIFFSFLVDINIFKQTDFNITVRLQDNVPRRVDNFFSFFSDVGSFEILVILIVGMLIFLRKIISGLVTFFLFGLLHIIEIFGKTTVENLPPPQFMLRTKHLVEFPQFHVRSEYSYPSGHSGRTIFISAFLIILIWYAKKLHLYVRLALICAIVCFAILMLVSRVYLGEHWMTDVVGGMLLGAGFGVFSGALYLRKGRKKHISA